MTGHGLADTAPLCMQESVKQGVGDSERGKGKGGLAEVFSQWRRGRPVEGSGHPKGEAGKVEGSWPGRGEGAKDGLRNPPTRDRFPSASPPKISRHRQD